MRKSILLIITGVTLVSASCKKDKNTDPQPTDNNDSATAIVPDFKTTGRLYAYEKVTFTSNYKDDMQLTWRFGDGDETTETGTGTEHTYQKAGVYNVTMLVVDSFGGSVTKDVHISNGLERMSGKYTWHFLLYRYKHGYSLGHIPNISFDLKYMTLDIKDDSTIQIPNVPQMPYEGPYKVVVRDINKDALVLKSDDNLSELSYSLVDFTGGIKIVQVRNDTTWTLNGYATIIH